MGVHWVLHKGHFSLPLVTLTLLWKQIQYGEDNFAQHNYLLHNFTYHYLFLLDFKQWHRWLRIGKRCFCEIYNERFHSCLRCSITTLLLFRLLCKMPLKCMWPKALMISFKIPSQVCLSSFFFLIKLDKVTHLSLQLWHVVIRRRGSLLVTILKRRGILREGDWSFLHCVKLLF